MNEQILRRRMADAGRSYEETEELLWELAERRREDDQDRMLEEKATRKPE